MNNRSKSPSLYFFIVRPFVADGQANFIAVAHKMRNGKPDGDIPFFFGVHSLIENETMKERKKPLIIF